MSKSEEYRDYLIRKVVRKELDAFDLIELLVVKEKEITNLKNGMVEFD